MPRLFCVYDLFAAATASAEKLGKSAFLAYAIQESEDNGQITAVADVFNKRRAAAAYDQ